ncbi:AcrR family transcriptional regulator [Actinoalloteichus hoggarensis]|uniref:Tetracycline repressor protein class E n=1 Tax=Actinoalloteichus hoggarensis TaxID=1470176 RepID=A0A221WBU2_9PSEU|nr:TetR/AcrR family transcriptional regulator C-terminal domain-containing protein [Actinoalloteichus hoggarensis]ASO23056.1 Tetracycline repressor protein class E [Actinoalloteichus hoggarensis]MBB5922661.1 AcrR family transcriptional regulator [Actinoalloteichus hoggarensis]
MTSPDGDDPGASAATEPEPGEGRQHGRPGRRLTTDRIVATAVALADAEGLDALTMREIADRLGVTTMSLYRYVHTKAELVGRMVDAAYADAPTFAGTHWRERVWELARADWRTYHRHPWLLRVPETRPMLGPRVIASFDAALAALDGSGLNGSQRTSTLQLINHFVRGAASDSIEELRTRTESGLDAEQWWAERHPEIRRHAVSGRHVALGRLLTEKDFPPPQDGLVFGMERICDGIQALIDSAPVDDRNDRRCPSCDAPVVSGATGRPRAYCSAACRQRAYRARAT